MKGADNGASFAANTQIIKDFQKFNNLPDNSNPGCYYNSSSSYCFGGGFYHESIGSNGSAYVFGISSENCGVINSGYSVCSE